MALDEDGLSDLGLVPFLSHLATDTIFPGRRRSYIGAGADRDAASYASSPSIRPSAGPL
jgi:hypothetical protein